MPTTYNEATLALIWEMLTVEGLTLKKAAYQLSTTTDKVNHIYQAAKKHYQRHVYKKPVTKPTPLKPPRHKGNYSNKKSLY